MVGKIKQRAFGYNQARLPALARALIEAPVPADV
jgi:hypothetical protein